MQVFDIGGTWFRCGHVDDAGNLDAVFRRPSSSFRSRPEASIATLQDDIVAFICEQTAAAAPLDEKVISISFGGVVDQRNGQILNAAPLWGAGAHALDLAARVRIELPDYEIYVYNDVSAAAAAYASRAPDLRRLGLLLVSTGCAFRAISRSLQPDVGRTHGLHGEIGHLRHELLWDGEPMHELCDCGGVNHLNAFSSGRAIHALWARAEGIRSGACPRDFQMCLTSGDTLAKTVLAFAIRPIANTILQIFTLDAKLDRIVLAGGVIDWLGVHYHDELMHQLGSAGLYEVTTRYPDFFASHVVVGQIGDDACLIGAHYLAAATGARQRVRTNRRPAQ